MEIATSLVPERLTYIGDPMCSWCYGFAPEIARVRDAFAGRIAVDVVTGGLRPHTREPMDERMRDFLRRHWHEVATRTGQPFDESQLARKGFVYDTEPACRAVVTARRLAPGRELGFFAAVQHAFYACGADMADPATYRHLAAAQGLDPDGFGKEFGSRAAAAATEDDFARTRALGVSGFPTLLVRAGDRHAVLCVGYARADDLIPWLEGAVRPAAH